MPEFQTWYRKIMWYYVDPGLLIYCPKKYQNSVTVMHCICNMLLAYNLVATILPCWSNSGVCFRTPVITGHLERNTSGLLKINNYWLVCGYISRTIWNTDVEHYCYCMLISGSCQANINRDITADL